MMVVLIQHFRCVQYNIKLSGHSFFCYRILFNPLSKALFKVHSDYKHGAKGCFFALYCVPSFNHKC